MAITLDIGGEGRHPQAWNLNPSRVKTVGRAKGQPIPKLISGRAESIPFPNHSVSRIIVERTPLRKQALSEIARVLAPGGWVVLRHVPIPFQDRHAPAKAVINGVARQRTCRIGGQTVQETRIRRPVLQDFLESYMIGAASSFDRSSTGPTLPINDAAQHFYGHH